MDDIKVGSFVWLSFEAWTNQFSLPYEVSGGYGRYSVQHMPHWTGSDDLIWVKGIPTQAGRCDVFCRSRDSIRRGIASKEDMEALYG